MKSTINISDIENKSDTSESSNGISTLCDHKNQNIAQTLQFFYCGLTRKASQG